MSLYINAKLKEKTIDESHTLNFNNPHNTTAAQVPYNNADSGLAATTVKDALDELASGGRQSFDFYLINNDVSPVIEKAIAGGIVIRHVYDGVTRYRFVPDPYSFSGDCFYSGFDSGTDTLSGQIICRGF